MPSGSTDYGFRVDRPDVLRRGAGGSVRLEAWAGDTQVEIASATLTLLGPDGQILIDEATATIDGTGAATYEILPADVPSTLPLSTLYQQRWALVMPDGSTPVVARETALAALVLYLPVVARDLTDVYPDLDAEMSAYDTGVQPWIDEAWRTVLDRLWGVGTWPDQLRSVSALREPTKHLALAGVFAELSRRSDGDRWVELRDMHREEYEASWARLSVRLDRDGDGLADSADRTSPTSGVLHRNAAPSRGRRWRRDPRF